MHQLFDNLNDFKRLIIAGTPNNPDLEAYCAKLEEYDTFLILSAGRFGKNDLQIAEKVKSINKSFFFVRTKIDQDVNNNWRDNGKDKESTLSEIREDCWENLSSVAASKKNVFLISNHQKDKWDFPGLRQAILDALEPQQRESLILSLTNDTKDVMKLKVKTLRGNYYRSKKKISVNHKNQKNKFSTLSVNLRLLSS